MNHLAQQNCSPAKASSTNLTHLEIDGMIKELTGWILVEKDFQQRLEKVFKFTNFNQAIAFSVQVARIADEQDHHPAILTEWGKVTVTWWTHAIPGLHLNDFIMAAKTDLLYTTQTA